VYVFLSSVGVALIFLGIYFYRNTMPDLTLWVPDAQAVQALEISTFPGLDSYFHPGGTVIEGAIAMHFLGISSYDRAIPVFLWLLGALCVGAIVSLCYLLRRNLLWCVAVLGVLSTELAYIVTSPASYLASLFTVFLTLFTLYLFETPGTLRVRSIIVWSTIAGALLATRIDIGSIAFVTFFLLLAVTLRDKKVLLLFPGTFIAFFIFDPYMWFTPIHQSVALVQSMITHYKGPKESITSSLYYRWHTLVTYEVPFFVQYEMYALEGIFFSIATLFLTKQMPPVLPRRFVLFFLGLTALVTGVVISAAGATRYMEPLLLVWEILLPLFVLRLIAAAEFRSFRIANDQQKTKYLFQIVFVFLWLMPIVYTFLAAGSGGAVF
jgi:hypothetical protein